MPKNNIRAKRRMLDLSQAKVAQAMPDGVDAVALGFIEHGRVLPTLSGMKALCELFQCKPADLYDPSEINLNNTPP